MHLFDPIRGRRSYFCHCSINIQSLWDWKKLGDQCRIKPRMGDIIIENRRETHIPKPRMGDIIIEIGFTSHDQTQNG